MLSCKFFMYHDKHKIDIRKCPITNETLETQDEIDNAWDVEVQIY